MKYLLIAFLWAAYCSLHSYLISIQFTNLMTRVFKKYYAFYRLAYVAISIILFIPLARLGAQLDHQIIITYGSPLAIIRYVFVTGSLLMFFWAFFFDYDSLTFWGIRQVLDMRKTKKTDPLEKVKKDGLLGIMRHPMYFALIIYIWCQTFRVMDIVVNTVFTLYILIGTRLEEKKLVMEFGDAYIRYQQEVPMLIPFAKTRIKLFPKRNEAFMVTKDGALSKHE
jgi:methanethiol S-methyltransferase